MSYQVLLDAPQAPVGRLQIAALGNYKHSGYGDFSITPENVRAWARNLAKLPGGRALIDLDHSADRSPRRTEAAGWITGIELDGDKPMADVEWTPVGRQAIEEKRYLFFSPSYGAFTDEHGTTHDDTCSGGALTNKPFIGSLPMITLAAPETMHKALEQSEIAEVTRLLYAQRSSDSRPPMAPTTATLSPQLLKALGLPEDATEQKLLDAVTDLQEKAKPAPKADIKTLEQQAAAEGKILLDSAQYAELKTGAAEGAQAAAELKATKFEVTFQRALDAGRAVPAQKDQIAHFYTLDAPGTLKMLDEGPQLVNVRPQGGSVILDDDAPDGVHRASHNVDRKVRAKLKQLDKPFSEYSRVLEQMMEDGEL